MVLFCLVVGGYGLWWQWLVVGVYGGGKWVG